MKRCIDLKQPSIGSNFNTKPLQPMRGEYMHTKDDIHDSITFCPMIKLFMDIPPSQRLRKLSQLGVTKWVYVTANHTRFEHSLGVAHLAEKTVRVIQRRQPQLGITEKDVLCVKLAGLCHDWGHGPFSHVFDGPFQDEMKKVNPDFVKIPHEYLSLMLIDYALKDFGLEIDLNNLDKPLKQIGDGYDANKFGVCDMSYDIHKPLSQDKCLTSRDWIFIKECILGKPLPGSFDFCGRPKEKEFLYDIVSNRHNGLDVDKIDYYARDEKRAHGKGGGLFVMFVNEAFVARSECPQPQQCFQCKKRKHPNEHYMICYPEKLVTNAMEFFKTRFRLHSNIYTHKTKPIELMICHILSKADPHIKLLNGKSKRVKMSEAINHPEAYLLLTDSIIDTIRNDNSYPEYKEVHDLIDRLQYRRLYKSAMCLPIENNSPNEHIWEMTESDIADELLQTIPRKHGSNQCKEMLVVDDDDIIVEKRTIHHGMKEKNPVNLMRFVFKHKLSALTNKLEELPLAIQIPERAYESHIPRSFQEKSIWIYSKSEEKRDLVRHMFEQYILWKQNEEKFKMTRWADYQSPSKEIFPVLLSQESCINNSESAIKVASVSIPNKRKRYDENSDHSPDQSPYENKNRYRSRSAKVKKSLAALMASASP